VPRLKRDPLILKSCEREDPSSSITRMHWLFSVPNQWYLGKPSIKYYKRINTQALQLFKDFGFTSEYLDLAVFVFLSTISKNSHSPFL
jgi:hypothetical protein